MVNTDHTSSYSSNDPSFWGFSFPSSLFSKHLLRRRALKYPRVRWSTLDGAGKSISWNVKLFLRSVFFLKKNYWAFPYPHSFQNKALLSESTLSNWMANTRYSSFSRPYTVLLSLAPGSTVSSNFVGVLLASRKGLMDALLAWKATINPPSLTAPVQSAPLCSPWGVTIIWYVTWFTD